MPFLRVSNTYLGVRFFRPRSHGDHKKTDHQEKASSDQTSDDNHKSTGQKNEKSAPSMIILVISCILTVFGFIVVGPKVWKHSSLYKLYGISNGLLTIPGIDFQAFAAKFLNTGDVREIVFFPGNARAVAILREGTVVDGQKVKTVVVSYSQTAKQLLADVRKEEAAMGISWSDGVEISSYPVVSMDRLIWLGIGISFVVWMGVRDFRLLYKAILQKRAAAAK